MSETIDVKQIAKLARLSLKPEEVSHLTKDLEGIIKFVEQLQKLNTEGVPPTSHPHQATDVFREDSVLTSKVRDDVLAQAPKREETYFKVPKVIESE